MKISASQRRTVSIKSASRVRANVRYFLWDLALRNFTFYFKSNLLSAVGCAVSALVLVGALLAGTSLRGSIRELHEPRLGEVKWVLNSSAGHIQKSIADSIGSALNVLTAPIQQLIGSAGTAGGSNSVHRVNIIGADERFWALGPAGTPHEDLRRAFCDSTGDISAVVNTALAKKLGLGIGSEIVLRFQPTGGLAPDAPFGRQDDNTATLRLPVTSVAGANHYGDFSLKAEHFTVYNVFIPLKLLQSVNNSPDMASAILVGKAGSEEDIMRIVRENLSIEDAGLNIRMADPNVDTLLYPNDLDYEMYSNRVFISDTLQKIVTEVISGAIPISSWFVNSIETDSAALPYSFVSTPPVRYKVNDNHIALSQWAADDLNASVGDTVRLTYFVPQPTFGLRTDTASLVVSAILENTDLRETPPPVRGYPANFAPDVRADTAPWLNRSLMPPYPGLAGAGSCNDWDPSIPVDLKKIREKDEEYWDKFGGTPKAVISYWKATQLWDNRFGVCTAIRIPRGAYVADNVGIVIHTIDDFKRSVAAALTPAVCGMHLTDVRAAVDKAVSGGMDFAPLFAGLSFFTFAAALILIWLLSTLQAKSRTDEYKILTAIGYSRKHILSIYLSEGMITFGLGTAAGVVLSPVYTLAIIWALKTVWRAAAHTPSLGLHIEMTPVVIGAAAAFVCALVGMMIPIWKSTRKFTDIRAAKISNESVIDKALDNFIVIMVKAYQRTETAVRSIIDVCQEKYERFIRGPKLPDDLELDSDTDTDSAGERRIHTTVEQPFNRSPEQKNAPASAGSAPDQKPEFDKTRLIMLNILREKKRVFGEIAILACALIVLGMTQLFRLDANVGSGNASGGTGGFTLYGEFNSGVPRDRTDAAFARERGVSVNERGIDFISSAMRMRDGGDASCLNLNRTESPTLLGVDQEQFDALGAFSFKSFIKAVDKERPWRILGTPADDGAAVYGIADANTIEWGLGKKVGDIVTYINESGDTLRVILAAALNRSIMQGKVIIAETDFVRHYPSTSGYRALLLSTDKNAELSVVKAFESYHNKSGLTLESAVERLNAFNAVENTYLSIFGALGVMGLMLGCLGMGIIVVRNIEERRRELAMLMALGFNADAIRRMLFAEHAVVAAAGAAAGLLPVTVAAAVSLSGTALLRIFFLLVVVLSCGAGAIMLGLQRFKGRELLSVLKEEV